MGAVMKLKTLQGYLQELKGFSEPKVQLEQYETPAHIAAVALYTIQVTKVITNYVMNYESFIYLMLHGTGYTLKRNK